MTMRHELGDAMDGNSGPRRRHRWRVLLAHDSRATCDVLFDSLGAALGTVDVSDATSVEGAISIGKSGRVDVALVCLDLPPAPQGGVRVARELLERGVPVVLVTRSLRWLPSNAGALTAVPWVAPDAAAEVVWRSIVDAIEAARVLSAPLSDTTADMSVGALG